MKSLSINTSFGNPKMNITLKYNKFFPNDKIEGKIHLESGNLLKKGTVIYKIYNEEKIIKKDKINIECHNSTEVYYNSLKYPGLIDYSLTKGINIPFEIILPSNIIPSFEFSRSPNNKNFGYIKYFLEVLIPELKLTKKKFIIIRKSQSPLNSPLSFKSEKNEKILGIFNKGNPLLIASYDKNCYFFKEEINLKICYNNNDCKLNIKNIKIRLLRNVIFKIKKKYKNLKDFVYSDELFLKIIKVNEILNIDNKNKDIFFDVKIKLEEAENIFNKHKIEYLDLGLSDKTNLIQFLPSFESSLFKCEYLIIIEGIYDTIMPINNLIIKMPISVFHNKNKNQNIEKNKNSLIDNNNISNSKINKKEDEKENEKEIKTYTNEKDKDWNNLTNGQIIPEFISNSDINK